MHLSRLTLLGGAAAAMIGTTVLAASHQEENPIVKARQAHMTLYGHNIGILGNMARGNTEYDAEAASAAAENLVSLATMNQASIWQPGTSAADVDGTKLKPELFENVSTAMQYREDLATAAMALAETAGDGLDGVRANIGALGEACGACHEDFRISDD